MDKHAVFNRIDGISVWQKKGQRAPHKPLLLLWSIGQYLDGHPRLICFSDLEENMKSLLKRFGPVRTSYHPEYPFHYLQHDGLWELYDAEGLRRKKGHGDREIPRSVLIENAVKGGLPTVIHRILLDDKEFLGRCVHRLLEAHFPQSMHEDVIIATGLGKIPIPIIAGRSKTFQSSVFSAYRGQCAVCRLNPSLNDEPIGLVATHIRWPQAGGKEQANNGLLLCRLHQKIYDYGGFAITPDYSLVISEHLGGEWLSATKASCTEIFLPEKDSDKPEPHNLQWHMNQVFR